MKKLTGIVAVAFMAGMIGVLTSGPAQAANGCKAPCRVQAELVDASIVVTVKDGVFEQHTDWASETNFCNLADGHCMVIHNTAGSNESTDWTNDYLSVSVRMDHVSACSQGDNFYFCTVSAKSCNHQCSLNLKDGKVTFHGLDYNPQID